MNVEKEETPRARGQLLKMKPSSTPATTPLKRLALHSTTTCSAQATAYGKCILATYTDVKKDICKEEFAKFGACLREVVRSISSVRRDDSNTNVCPQMGRKW